MRCTSKYFLTSNYLKIGKLALTNCSVIWKSQKQTNCEVIFALSCLTYAKRWWVAGTGNFQNFVKTVQKDRKTFFTNFEFSPVPMLMPVIVQMPFIVPVPSPTFICLISSYPYNLINRSTANSSRLLEWHMPQSVIYRHRQLSFTTLIIWKQK